MLIKIIFGVISVAACTAGGYWLSLRFAKRRAFFLDFCAFNQLMQREVGFAKSTLKEIFAKADYGAEFTQAIRMFEGKKAIELPLLNKRENEFLQSYFRVLGKDGQRYAAGVFQRAEGADRRIFEYGKGG